MIGQIVAHAADAAVKRGDVVVVVKQHVVFKADYVGQLLAEDCRGQHQNYYENEHHHQNQCDIRGGDAAVAAADLMCDVHVQIAFEQDHTLDDAGHE